MHYKYSSVTAQRVNEGISQISSSVFCEQCVLHVRGRQEMCVRVCVAGLITVISQ